MYLCSQISFSQKLIKITDYVVPVAAICRLFSAKKLSFYHLSFTYYGWQIPIPLQLKNIIFEGK
jgi:hypothetical protein